MKTGRTMGKATTLLVSVGAIAGVGGMAAGQSAPGAAAQPATTAATTTAAQPGTARASTNPKRDTLAQMQRRLSIDFTDARLEDVITFVKEVTGADLEPVWTSGNVIGLDKDKRLTLSIKNQPALLALEKILEKTQDDFQQNTWQMSDHGSMEIGPKDALNKTRRVEIYDINDLLHVIPRYSDVPTIDLQSVLQQGDGGGQSPFDEGNEQNADVPRTRAERTQDVIDLLINLVETDQWVDNGGEAATIRAWNGQLIVRAPDYMHRQINGYPYWPSHTTRKAGGARYVSLDMDAGIGTIDGFAQHPVTAVVGGRPISSGPPGGGGNAVPPAPTAPAPSGPP